MSASHEATGSNETIRMTTTDLIELAALDALALLDEPERVAFERALASATPGVQAHVRREQARLAHLEMLLPAVEPPADLRDRVIHAVRTASVDELAEELLGAGAVRHAGGRVGPSLLPSRRVSPVWRASSIGFATAAVVFGAFIVWLQNSHSELERQMQSNAVLEALVSQAGAEASEILVGAGSFKRALRPVPDAATPYDRAAAAVWVNATGEVVVFHQNLARGSGVRYELVAMDQQGQETGERFALEGSTAGGLYREVVRGASDIGGHFAIVATVIDRSGQTVSTVILSTLV